MIGASAGRAGRPWRLTADAPCLLICKCVAEASWRQLAAGRPGFPLGRRPRHGARPPREGSGSSAFGRSRCQAEGRAFGHRAWEASAAEAPGEASWRGGPAGGGVWEARLGASVPPAAPPRSAAACCCCGRGAATAGRSRQHKGLRLQGKGVQP